MLKEESVKNLTVINDVQFLGVYLDCHLSWNNHVNELVLKLKKIYFLDEKISKLLCDLASLKTVYCKLLSIKIIVLYIELGIHM